MSLSCARVRTFPLGLSSVGILALCTGFLVAGCGHNGGGGDAGPADLAPGADLSGGGGDLLPAGPDMANTCGNGVIDPGETCDDGNDVSGDGCSSTCQVEIGWQCPVVGMACVRQSYCGDGIVEPPETCDDGNSTPGDGCSGTCQTEPNYTCMTPTPPPSPPHEVCTSTIVCGNGTVDPGEECDTGNNNGVAGSGCSSTCQIVAGYTCAGQPSVCTLNTNTPVCGDGRVEAGEECDAGSALNGVAGSGCSSTCQIVAGYTCPTAGQACVLICGNGVINANLGERCDAGANNGVAGSGCSSTCQIVTGYECAGAPSVCTLEIVCDNGRIDPGETCDDGNTTSGDGCSSTCALEPGWTCPFPDSPCVAAKCGDGVVAGTEQCDLGTQNGVAGSGCSATCTVVAGYACTTSGTPATSSCAATTCGDGKVQGAEQCDDGNLIPYDGCSPTCTVDPGWTCTGQPSVCTRGTGSSTATCGDGIIEPGEDCDDGNTQSGDGCSSTCTVETGWTCTPETQAAPSSLTIPILYRDMIHECNGTTTQTCTGCKCSAAGKTCTCNTNQMGCGTATYTYTNTCGGVAPPTGTTPNPDFDNPTITQYANGAITGLVSSTLGTDAEPVFLSADGSSTHAFLLGDTTLDPTMTAAQVYYWWYHETNAGQPTNPYAANPYDKLVYLDASNNPTTLTLTTTDTTPSVNSVYTYTSTNFFPLDNLGWNANAATAQVDVGGSDDKSHNFSFTSELHYVFTYSHAQAAGAHPAVFTFTGDDDVWAFINGTQIADLGGIHSATTKVYTLNNTNAEDTVADGGLGLVDGGWYSIDVFQAERHITGSDYTLSLQGFVHQISVCSPICGDGVVEVGEACDLGSANAGSVGPPNTIAYNGCSADCKTRGPYCGDDIVQDPPEQCDQGAANYTSPTYGAGYCTPACQDTPYCGDGIVQPQYGEQCDPNDPVTGANCTSKCTLTDLCGDGIIEGSESCDDGVNNGAPGDPCSATCTLLCGDGMVETGEACDLGSTDSMTHMPCTTPGVGNCVSNNVGGYGGCNANCTLAPYCGDGIKNGTEQCDFGTANNNGAYGGCNMNCTLAPYCGDGVKNGTEQCDCGSTAQTENPQCTALNSQNAYGQGKCTTTCQTAPYCGDGIVEASFGEQCDGGAGCNNMCKQEIE